jgi:hypothetical protein
MKKGTERGQVKLWLRMIWQNGMMESGEIRQKGGG